MQGAGKRRSGEFECASLAFHMFPRASSFALESPSPSRSYCSLRSWRDCLRESLSGGRAATRAAKPRGKVGKRFLAAYAAHLAHGGKLYFRAQYRQLRRLSECLNFRAAKKADKASNLQKNLRTRC